jgi:syntaxin-binding protein 1
MTSFPSKMDLNTRACNDYLVMFLCRDVTVMHCRYKFQSSVGTYEDKAAVLSDADSVWADVRHMHMREAIDKLMADFNKFITDNAGFKGCAWPSCMR